MLMAHRRVVIKDQVTIKTPPLVVRVGHLSQRPLEQVSSDQVKALSNEILATLRDIIRCVRGGKGTRGRGGESLPLCFQCVPPRC